MKKFIALYRVSTENQAEHRIGLDSQQQVVTNYVKSVGGELIDSYEEVISGGYKEPITGNVSLESLLRKRPSLLEAINRCKAEGAILIAKEASRITRSPLVMEFLINSNIKFMSADSPEDGTMILRLKTVINAEELIKVSERTKAALAERKRQLKAVGFFISKTGNIVTSLGNNNIQGYNSLPRPLRVNKEMKKLSGYVKFLRERGMKLIEIAYMLNEDGYKTPHDKGFDESTVHRLINNY